MSGTGEEQQATGGGGAGCGWVRAFGRALQAGADESAAGATGSDPEREGPEREGPERERAAWWRAEERMHWERIQQWRRQDLGKLERRSKREWSELYGRQEREREQLAKDCHGVVGRFRAWRELGGKLREIGGTIRGRTEVLGRFRAELETRQRLERISLGKAHSEAVRKIESLAGEVYRGGMEGAEGRAREATRRDPLAVYNRYRGGDWDRLKRSASEERMEQVREFDGEQAYEKMLRAMEEARQEKARQAERARQNGEGLEASGGQKAGAPWAGTQRAGAGLWPQPVGSLRASVPFVVLPRLGSAEGERIERILNPDE